MKFSITVTLKKDVLDPQGKVVQNTLINMVNNLTSIRQGKFLKLKLMKVIKVSQKKLMRCKTLSQSNH